MLILIRNIIILAGNVINLTKIYYIEWKPEAICQTKA